MESKGCSQPLFAVLVVCVIVLAGEPATAQFANVNARAGRLAMDANNFYLATNAGLRVFSRSGTQLQTISVGEVAAVVADASGVFFCYRNLAQSMAACELRSSTSLGTTLAVSGNLTQGDAPMFNTRLSYSVLSRSAAVAEGSNVYRVAVPVSPRGNPDGRARTWVKFLVDPVQRSMTGQVAMVVFANASEPEITDFIPVAPGATHSFVMATRTNVAGVPGNVASFFARVCTASGVPPTYSLPQVLNQYGNYLEFAPPSTTTRTCE